MVGGQSIKEQIEVLNHGVDICVGTPGRFGNKGEGLVMEIFQEKNWVIVEGLNTKIERIGRENDDTAMVVMREKPLNVTTDIKHVDPSDLCVSKNLYILILNFY